MAAGELMQSNAQKIMRVWMLQAQDADQVRRGACSQCTLHCEEAPEGGLEELEAGKAGPLVARGKMRDVYEGNVSWHRRFWPQSVSEDTPSCC